MTYFTTTALNLELYSTFKSIDNPKKYTVLLRYIYIMLQPLSFLVDNSEDTTI